MAGAGIPDSVEAADDVAVHAHDVAHEVSAWSTRCTATARPTHRRGCHAHDRRTRRRCGRSAPTLPSRRRCYRRRSGLPSGRRARRYDATRMWLPWKAALALAAALAIVPFLVVIGLFAKPRSRHVQYALSFARETAVVLALYALWQFAGTLSLLQVVGAVARGRWIFHFEHQVHLPTELRVQHGVLTSAAVTQALNVFYATVHFPAMITFLIWMFVRHRDHYPQVRNTVVLVTGSALAIQLIPVAPPRLTTGLGFVDTPALFHQSVYARVGAPGPDQLSAMPSVHVAWAVMVALGASCSPRAGAGGGSSRTPSSPCWPWSRPATTGGSTASWRCGSSACRSLSSGCCTSRSSDYARAWCASRGGHGQTSRYQSRSHVVTCDRNASDSARRPSTNT